MKMLDFFDTSVKLRGLPSIFCCDKLKELITNKKCPLKYSPNIRQYTLTLPKYYFNEDSTCISYEIYHCPKCGSEFPPNLVDEWYNLMEKKFKITDWMDSLQLKNIPQEFKTEEWWKKRKL